MKNEKIAVSRTIEIPGQASVERKTNVSVRMAENANDMTDICAGDMKVAIDYFNAGRWAELRTKVSNALAGKSPQQKAFDKMCDAWKTMNPGMTDEAVRTMIMSMPGMADATAVNIEILPTEIDDTYFDEKKAAKAAAETVPAGK